jgi:hypothetical protein
LGKGEGVAGSEHLCTRRGTKKEGDNSKLANFNIQLRAEKEEGNAPLLPECPNQPPVSTRFSYAGQPGCEDDNYVFLH